MAGFARPAQVDATATHMLRELVEDVRKRGARLVLSNPNHSVMESLDRANITDVIGRRYIFMRMHDAVM